MKLSKFLHVLLVMVLPLVTLQSQADDTDLFKQPSGVSSAAPNIIFILDNTANWSRAAQQWVGSSTAGDAELLAIKKFVAGLTQPANVGLMEFTTIGQTGGYVRYGLRDMTNGANNSALQNIVSGIDVNSSSEKVNQNSGSIANTLYESWLYLNGSASWAGMSGNADYAGNVGLTPAGRSLGGGFAYKGSSANASYNSPLGTNCAKTYIIFIGNNGPSSSPAQPASTDPSSTTLSTYGYTSTPDVQSA